MATKKTTKATAKKKVTAKKGLGDAVEVIAKPIAKAIDSVAGTDIEHCAACEERKGILNRFSELMGFKPHREPTDEDIDLIVKFFERDTDKVTKFDQKVLIPIHNRLFFRKDKPTNCFPCWNKIQSRLKIIYDATA